MNENLLQPCLSCGAHLLKYPWYCDNCKNQIEKPSDEEIERVITYLRSIGWITSSPIKTV